MRSLHRSARGHAEVVPGIGAGGGSLKNRLAAALALAVLVGFARDAQGQLGRARRPAVRVPPPQLGPRVGYDFEADHWSVGGQLRIPGRRLELLGSGDYYFAAGARTWQANLDLALRLGRLSSLYAGGGVGLFHQSTDDWAANVVVGLQPPTRRGTPLRPYAEGRWTFLDNVTPFRFVFGANLVLGR